MAQETDFKSMAYSLIPAAFGLMTGGGLGAAAGFTRGVGDYDDERMKQEKYYEELRMKQEDQQLKQNENARQEQELVMRRDYQKAGMAHWEVQNEAAKVGSELTKAKTAEAGVLLGRLKEEEAAREKALAGKTPEERAAAMSNWEQYSKEMQKKITEAPLRAGIAPILKSLGLPEAWAEHGDMKEINQAVQATSTARSDPGRMGLYGMGGSVFLYNDRTGKTSIIASGLKTDRTISPEKRSQIEGAILKQWRADNPAQAQLIDQTGELGDYQKFRDSPLGELEERFFNGDIDHKERSAERKEIMAPIRREEYVEGKFKEAVMGVNKKMTPVEYEKYKESEAGQKQLNAYRFSKYGQEALRKFPSSKSAASAPAAPVGAPAPAKQEIPTDPEERKKYIQQYMFGGSAEKKSP